MTDNKPTHEDELKAPEVIWLQLGFGDEGGHTWCEHETEWEPQVKYTRASTPAPMGDEVREAVEHISKKLELDRSYVGSFSDSDDSHVSRIVRSKMKTIKIYETLITAAKEAGRLRLELAKSKEQEK